MKQMTTLVRVIANDIFMSKFEFKLYSVTFKNRLERE